MDNMLARTESLPMTGGQADQMIELLRSMAGMIRATNERMTALENEVRRLTKVTPAQAAAINRAIRARAEDECRAHRCPGAERAAGTAIRKSLRLVFGITGVRDLPRADYAVAMRHVGMWDDYDIMTRLKRGVRA